MLRQTLGWRPAGWTAWHVWSASASARRNDTQTDPAHAASQGAPGADIEAQFQSTKGEGRAIRRRSPGSSRAGREFSSPHNFCSSASRKNSVRSARTRWAARTRLATANWESSIPASRAARSMSARSSAVHRTSRRFVRFWAFSRPRVSGFASIAEPFLYVLCAAPQRISIRTTLRPNSRPDSPPRVIGPSDFSFFTAWRLCARSHPETPSAAASVSSA